MLNSPRFCFIDIQSFVLNTDFEYKFIYVKKYLIIYKILCMNLPWVECLRYIKNLGNPTANHLYALPDQCSGYCRFVIIAIVKDS